MSISFSNIVGTPGSSTLTSKGDILSHDGTNPSRIPVGTNGQALYVNSSASNGISWSTAPAGGATSADFEPIAYSSITANTSSVEFSNIPGTYASFLLIGMARATSDSSVDGVVKLNSNTTADVYGYFAARTYESTLDSTVVKNDSSGFGIESSVGTSSNSGNFGKFTLQIDNYANTSKYKSVAYRGSCTPVDNPADGTLRTTFGTGIFRSTSAITSIQISYYAALSSGSWFALYGIK